VTSASLIQIRVGSPTGPLFAYSGSSGSSTTGKWVTNGMAFYLLNAANGQVLGTATVGVNSNGCLITKDSFSRRRK
jgi:hypothetical protein